MVVVIHGGYWRSQYGAELGEPLARDLAAHGMAAWNLEYRRAGNGGGWPHTFEDILAGIDQLADLAGTHALDLGRVVALGHSAGGHLAVWAAGRQQAPELGRPTPTASPRRRTPRGPPDRRGQPVRPAQPGRGGEAEPQQRCRQQPDGRDRRPNTRAGTGTPTPWRRCPWTFPCIAVHANDDTTFLSQSESIRRGGPRRHAAQVPVSRGPLRAHRSQVHGVQGVPRTGAAAAALNHWCPGRFSGRV